MPLAPENPELATGLASSCLKRLKPAKPLGWVPTAILMLSIGLTKVNNRTKPTNWPVVSSPLRVK